MLTERLPQHWQIALGLLLRCGSDASEGDTIELYVDGEQPAIFSQTLTAENITAGNINTGELEFGDEIDQDVFLEIAVKRSDGIYIQHDGHVTWEYQW